MSPLTSSPGPAPDDWFVSGELKMFSQDLPHFVIIAISSSAPSGAATDWPSWDTSVPRFPPWALHFVVPYTEWDICREHPAVSRHPLRQPLPPGVDPLQRGREAIPSMRPTFLKPSKIFRESKFLVLCRRLLRLNARVTRLPMTQRWPDKHLTNSWKLYLHSRTF